MHKEKHQQDRRIINLTFRAVVDILKSAGKGNGVLQGEGQKKKKITMQMGH